MPNRLIHATSPYLRQHAHNPVEWFPWGEEALAKARAEDKPILVSIGYSSCHWCHVMERESFENTDIAALMNEHFVCIKVDREERPDIDQIYMDAVQAMKINGGWPLNVFLTPDQKPFYGGTYFPPPRWASVLTQLQRAFRERRREIDESAEDLTRHLNTSDTHRFVSAPVADFRWDAMQQAFDVLHSRFDHEWGGIDKAPKFVMPAVWQWLAMYQHVESDTKAAEMLHVTLQKMADAGLYDQLRGGFARYSVDNEWFAPHFEKMLYDNGQLLSLYATGYQMARLPRYAEILIETFEWLAAEMQHPQGGFYSALDADSEGMEGRYYVWTYAEWEAALTTQAALLADFYAIEKTGNWEHGFSILKRPQDVDQWLSGRHLAPAFVEQLKTAKRALLDHREKRPRPGLDDKILTGWNALTITGLVRASLATAHPHLLEAAEQAMRFLETQLIHDGKVLRSFKEKPNPTEAFLEDYAALIEAYAELYQATFREAYLTQAETLTTYVFTHFFDAEEGYFHFTSHGSEKLIARKKEIFDNVIPSSNALMAGNLISLGTLLQKPTWLQAARQMTSGLASLIAQEPVYLSRWAQVFARLAHGTLEVVITGPEARDYRAELGRHHLPFALFCGTSHTSDLPLLRDRTQADGLTRIFICQNNTCQRPVTSVAEALDVIKHVGKSVS
ncbi:MAG: thioredoxin domain-containing protein [Cyclobacteriaceae bacterium]|jgi:hypothetical protein|nr:thioredoxin domain-containing protein [Cyclobacteriaceae bacterium]